jgi:hypothetical protein
VPVFGEINRAQDADRQTDERAQADNFDRPHNGVGDAAARFADRLGELREEIEVDRRKTMIGDVAEDHEKRGQRDRREDGGDAEHHAIDYFSAGEVGRGHLRPLFLNVTL